MTALKIKPEVLAAYQAEQARNLMSMVYSDAPIPTRQLLGGSKSTPQCQIKQVRELLERFTLD
jgi:hypothetical protein